MSEQNEIEVLSDYSRQMNSEMERMERHFQKRIEILSRLKTKKYMVQLLYLMKDAGAYDAAFVKSVEKGEKQSSDYRAIKWEWIDQYENGGYSGDSFSGFIYIQVKPNRFLRLQYAM